jgi:hypothetical protein
MEKMRAAEAIAARDVIAQHLSLACKSIRDKAAIIDTLRQQNKYLEDILKEHTSANTAVSDQLHPAGQEAPCAGPIDENSKLEDSAQKEPLASDVITEEDPPEYEVTEAFSQVGDSAPFI